MTGAELSLALGCRGRESVWALEQVMGSAGVAAH